MAFVVAGCGNNPGSVAVAPPAPDPVVIETVSETSSGSEEFVPDPIGGSEHSDAELDGSLASLAARAPSPPPIPVNGVVIVNRDTLDGSALSVNQTLNLRAIAGDAQGVDISSRIQWLNAAGTVIGTGGTLAYSSAQAKMETLTARRRDATTQRQRISFTVSPATVLVARFVKVLSDAVAADVRELNLAQNLLVLTQSDRLPVIRIGDVVIGAAGRVPPLRVSQIQYLNGTQRLTVSEALPRQVIRRGSASFTQAVDWSGSTPPEGVELINIPADPFHIAEVLTPKWPGFVRAGSNVSKRLTVKANASFSWQPTYSGTIAFDSAFGEGIRRINLQQNGLMDLNFLVTANGFIDWLTYTEYYQTLLPLTFQQITVMVGPIPVPVDFFQYTDLAIFPLGQVMGKSQIGLNLGNGNLSETISYDASLADPWNHFAQLIGGQPTTTISDDSRFWGYLNIAIQPHIDVAFFHNLISQSGLNLYAKTSSELNDYSVDSPNNSQASVQGEIQVTATTGGEISHEIYTFSDSISANNNLSPRKPFLAPAKPPVRYPQSYAPNRAAPGSTYFNLNTVRQTRNPRNPYNNYYLYPSSLRPGGVIYYGPDGIPVMPSGTPPPVEVPSPDLIQLPNNLTFPTTDRFRQITQCTPGPTPSPSPTPCPSPASFCPKYWRDDRAGSPAPNQCLPDLPPQTNKCYKHSQNQDRAECYRRCLDENAVEERPLGIPYQSHHPVQEAAVKGLGGSNGTSRYSSSGAYTILLCGGSGYGDDTPHQCANNFQNSKVREAGTILSEIDLGLDALIIAQECAPSLTLATGSRAGVDGDEILKVMECAQDYFYTELKWPTNFQTKPVPKPRTSPSPNP